MAADSVCEYVMRRLRLMSRLLWWLRRTALAERTQASALREMGPSRW